MVQCSGGLIRQAQSQLAVAKGAPVEWRFAEKEAMEVTRRLFEQNAVTGITLTYMP